MKTDVNKFLETIVNVQPIDGDIFKNLYESSKKRDEMLKDINYSKSSNCCISSFINPNNNEVNFFENKIK